MTPFGRFLTLSKHKLPYFERLLFSEKRSDFKNIPLPFLYRNDGGGVSMQKKSWRLEILDAPPLEQNTMHTPAYDKGPV